MNTSAITLHTVCGLDELVEHEARGVSHVLSILDPDTPDPTAFTAYGTHKRTVLRFHDAIEPGPDVVLPEREHVAAILDFGRAVAEEGAQDAHILVHCHVGISRSTAALLTLFAQAEPETSAEALVARLHAQREKAWPNARLVGFADAMLGREGSLIEATRQLHALQLRKRPHLEPLMRDLKRGAEIDAALRG
ncbi:protein-tyrosine-phosphatase [Methylobacterium organophilum]|uniref:tyrosine phosphatase family protein n=1 Tax=Methylobacterium organophilum TaxID=410 RepID=UPI001F12EB75|nr:protein-tyrosine phosphatase family protein [Methylobacterium organophilum]UMY17727.1 protein-tyrosine-phosphatase [Methylobacterium organophilum]